MSPNAAGGTGFIPMLALLLAIGAAVLVVASIPAVRDAVRARVAPDLVDDDDASRTATVAEPEQIDPSLYDERP